MNALYAECDVRIGDASTGVDTEKVELPKQEPERKSLFVSSLSSSRSLPPTEKFLPEHSGKSARPKPTLRRVSNLKTAWKYAAYAFASISYRVALLPTT